MLCVLHGSPPEQTAPSQATADQPMDEALRQQKTELPPQSLRAVASDAQGRVTPSYSNLIRTLELLVGELGSAATAEDAHFITAAIKHCCDAADALSSLR